MESSSSKKSEKKRAGSASNNSSNTKRPKQQQQQGVDRAELHKEIGYETMSLESIRDRLVALCQKVPPIPESNFEIIRRGKKYSARKCAVPIDNNYQPLVDSDDDDEEENGDQLPYPRNPCEYNRTELREWATSLQTCLEEFYLLVALVSPATYRWGTDRSGAAEQNLALLSQAFVQSQEQITARVTTRLNDVLAPVVTLVTTKTVTTKQKKQSNNSNNEDEEIKRNYFTTTVEDPDYVHLAFTILARNSHLLRQIVLANFDKLLRAMADYLEAQQKDAQHDSRGFVY